MKISNLKPKKPKARRVLGIDASTQSIAFTLYFNRRPVKWGKINLEGNDIYEKCGDAAAKTNALLEQLDIDYVAIEQAIYVLNRAIVIKLAYVYGAIIGTTMARGIPCTDVAPVTWMAHIGNNPLTKAQKATFNRKNKKQTKSWRQKELRRQRKQRTIDYFNKRYKMKLSDDDVADSAGVGLYAYEELTRRR